MNVTRGADVLRTGRHLLVTSAAKNSTAGGRSSRRLARHVLMPVLVGGLLIVVAVAAIATGIARQAAFEALDARAEGVRTLAGHAVRAGDSPARVAALGRRAGAQVEVLAADESLPGGYDVSTRGGQRVYTFTVRADSRGNRRVRIALSQASATAATKRALLTSLGAGALLLVLLTAGLAARVNRLVVVPLRRLAHAVERLGSGHVEKVPQVGGPREVRSVGAGLEAVSAVLVDLHSQATTDPLTKVGNRRSFHEALEREAKRASRQGTSMTLVLLDLDGFKAINDTHGHPFGDGVLQLIASKLQSELRATDVLARVGGDEFAMVFPDTDAAAAAAIVERTREEAVGSTAGLPLTWSAGIATLPEHARDVETLVDCADAALYCAKSGTGSTVYEYDPADADAPHGSDDRADVEALLAHADAVQPVFQPIVSLTTGHVTGFEALARFPHPPARRPDEWFAIAQRCGLGAEMEARAVKAALESAPPPEGTFLSFNLSPTAIASDAVMSVLPEDLSCIVIEITNDESAAAYDDLAARLAPLRARGARIAIDEAGTSYSGLQQVMRAQPDLIKLDRSLVANADSDHAKAALIDSFVRFARRTGASVCAEGVETPEELKVLADLDVSYGQGFGIARPAAPWATVSPWVAATVRPRTSRTAGAAPHGRDWEQNDDLRLAQLMSHMAGATSVKDLRAMMPLVAAELEADEVLLLRRSADNASLEPLTEHAWLAPRGMNLADHPTVREVLASHEVLQVSSGGDNSRRGPSPLLERSGSESMLIAPVTSQGEVVGVVATFRAGTQPWSRTETSRVQIVAHQLGPVIERLAAPMPVTLLPPPPTAVDGAV
jgi:diguanylate cyclase (GGDEF)-like protein